MREIIYYLRTFYSLYEMGYLKEGKEYEKCKEIERALEALTENEEAVIRGLYVQKIRPIDKLAKAVCLSQSHMYRIRKKALTIMCAVLNKELD